MANLSRRHFMSGAGALGFAGSMGALSGLGASKAWAANTSGYKAMVCIFLKGGMDHADTVLPYDQPSYNQLASVRDGLFGTYNATSGASTRNRANLLKLNAQNASSFAGQEFALPPELSPMHQMFEDGDLAVVGNVGPLIEPTTRAQMENNTALVPKRLFSHNDQQSTWMSLGTEGQRFGWGGRFLDAALASSPSADAQFAAITSGSNDVFLSGDRARPFRVANGGAPEAVLVSNRNYLGYSSEDDEARRRIRAFLGMQNIGDNNIFAQDMRNANGEGIATSDRLLEARENSTPITADFPANSLGGQLKSVAETIQIQQFLNSPRQIFYCTTGGFDTHNNQANSIGGLHTGLAGGIAAFKAAMQEIGEWNNVLVFTMSDFGRTMIDNGDGTDHGWGGHHFVAGGSVVGKNIYGSIPTPDIDGENYTKSRGRMIPTTSVDQYAATLGKWFGLSGSELDAVLPSLGNFNSRDLGFLGGSGS